MQWLLGSLLLLGSFLSGTNLMAQAPTRKVQFGFSLGPEYYGVDRPPNPGNAYFKTKLGYELRTTVGMNFGKHLGLLACLGTSLQRYLLTIYGGSDVNSGFEITSSYHNQAFRASLLFKFALKQQQRGFFFTIGPESEKVYQPPTRHRSYLAGNLESEYYSQPFWFPLMVGTLVSIGYKSRLSDRWQWSVEPFGRCYPFNYQSWSTGLSRPFSVGMRLGLWI